MSEAPPPAAPPLAPPLCAPPPPAPLPPAPPPAPSLPNVQQSTGPKLKPLVWQKVPKNRLKGTIWQTVKDGAVEAPSFDRAQFEILFLAKPPCKPAVLSRAGSSAGGVAAAVLLDPKRANNLAIILSRLRLPNEEIRRAVVHLDAEVLSPEAVSALQKCVPLPEEIELVATAEPASLGFAERFVLQVGSVPRLKQRLETFAFKHKFNGALHSLWSELNLMTNAAVQLVGCPPLHRLLGLLLTLGNALNQGSFRSGAEGFRLECLTRLAELKANDKNSSLLQYAVATAAGQGDGSAAASAPLVSFASECGAVRQAAKLSSAELLEEVAALRSGLALVEAELEHFDTLLSTSGQNGKQAAAERRGGVDGAASAACSAEEEALVAQRFVQVMKPFRDGAAPQLDELECHRTRMEEAQKVLRAYYAEEAKTSIEEIYGRWATFLGQVDVAVANHNEDLKKAECKRK